MGKLQGQVAIVTGSDSGIGQATAIAFAEEGADVAVTYFSDLEGAGRTRRSVESLGRRAYLTRLDQREPQSVAKLFQETEEALGKPTILVNNAAIGGEDAPVKELDPAEWDDVIKTDLYGPFYCCQEFIRRLEGTGKHGAIINISSVHQQIVQPGMSAYNAAKAGLMNLTKTLALELAESNINVNSIAPGMVLTPMNEEAMEDPELRARQEQNIPMKRAAHPEEIARTAVFLASSDARYIQGETIFVDGALTLLVGQGA